MGILIRIILLLLLPFLAGAANYYVDATSGDNGNDGSIDHPWQTVAGLASKTATLQSGDWALFKRGETWAEKLAVNKAGLKFGAYGIGNPPIFTGDANYSYEVLAANQTAYGLWFKIKPIYSYEKSGVVFAYNIVSDMATIGSTFQNADVSIFNNLFVKIPQYALTVSGTGYTGTVTNNIFFGVGGPYSPIRATQAEVVYSNNMVMAATFDPSIASVVSACYEYSSGTCTDGGNNKITDNSDPKFVSYQYPHRPKVLLRFADDQNFAVCMAQALKSYGVKASYYGSFSFVQSTIVPNGSSTDNCVGGPYSLSDVQALIDDGTLKVMVRGGSGNSISVPTDVFSISTTNGGTNTLTINGVAKTLTLTSTGNPGNNVTLDWSADATMDGVDLNSALTGKGWAYTNLKLLSGYYRLSSLKDQTCTEFPCSVSFDDDSGASRWFYDESIAARNSIRGFLSRDVAYFFVYPTPSTPVTAFGDYLLSTGIYVGSAATGQSNDSLSSVNLFELDTLGDGDIPLVGTKDEAHIRAGARIVWANAVANGGIINISYHNMVADLTLEEFLYVVDEWNKLGVEWGFFEDFANSLKASHATVDSMTYTKTYTDSNYHLFSNSSAINAGVDVGLTTDILGNPIEGPPDIGPFEYGGRALSLGAGSQTVTIGGTNTLTIY